MDGLLLWSAVLCALLVGVHLSAAWFHQIVGSKKQPTHSVLAGITTGYLFLMLLPSLRPPAIEVSGWPLIDEAGGTVLFGIALAGFVVYYAVEVWARAGRGARNNGEPTEEHVYRVHLISFTLFSVAVAYLVPFYLSIGVAATVAYMAALAVHLLVLDHSLAEMHGGRYDIYARASLSGGIVAGWLLILLTGPEPPAIATDLLKSFLAGAITLNVIKEELPAEKFGRPLAFLAGVLLFWAVMALGRILDHSI